jgi:hypothetical protein
VAPDTPVAGSKKKIVVLRSKRTGSAVWGGGFTHKKTTKKQNKIKKRGLKSIEKAFGSVVSVALIGAVPEDSKSPPEVRSQSVAPDDTKHWRKGLRFGRIPQEVAK